MRCMVANGLGIQKGYFITAYGEKNLELQNFFANDAKCCKNVIFLTFLGVDPTKSAALT